MKKTIGLVLTAATLSLVACGPSAEEQAAQTKLLQDSLTKVMTDSLENVALIQKAYDDSVATAAQMAEMQRVNDSLATASKASDAKAKAATKPKPAPTKPKNEPAPTDPTKVKPGQGRG